eukprot:TRINITY_DN13110_c0_g1_i1.p1 TRINITY_DN13110_c0_g1~~TRINITY_DN13110_c0_g1_i1.p1  ORF type:complete len:1245 (+),score=121.79 TRINITY_DN13110_c0_g1_i1:52-3786(+)
MVPWLNRAEANVQCSPYTAVYYHKCNFAGLRSRLAQRISESSVFFLLVQWCTDVLTSLQSVDLLPVFMEVFAVWLEHLLEQDVTDIDIKLACNAAHAFLFDLAGLAKSLEAARASPTLPNGLRVAAAVLNQEVASLLPHGRAQSAQSNGLTETPHGISPVSISPTDAVRGPPSPSPSLPMSPPPLPFDAPSPLREASLSPCSVHEFVALSVGEATPATVRHCPGGSATALPLFSPVSMAATQAFDAAKKPLSGFQTPPPPLPLQNGHHGKQEARVDKSPQTQPQATCAYVKKEPSMKTPPRKVLEPRVNETLLSSPGWSPRKLSAFASVKREAGTENEQNAAQCNAPKSVAQTNNMPSTYGNEAAVSHLAPSTILSTPSEIIGKPANAVRVHTPTKCRFHYPPESPDCQKASPVHRTVLTGAASVLTTPASERECCQPQRITAYANPLQRGPNWAEDSGTDDAAEPTCTSAPFFPRKVEPVCATQSTLSDVSYEEQANLETYTELNPYEQSVGNTPQQTPIPSVTESSYCEEHTGDSPQFLPRRQCMPRARTSPTVAETLPRESSASAMVTVPFTAHSRSTSLQRDTRSPNPKWRGTQTSEQKPFEQPHWQTTPFTTSVAAPRQSTPPLMARAPTPRWETTRCVPYEVSEAKPVLSRLCATRLRSASQQSVIMPAVAADISLNSTLLGITPVKNYKGHESQFESPASTSHQYYGKQTTSSCVFHHVTDSPFRSPGLPVRHERVPYWANTRGPPTEALELHTLPHRQPLPVLDPSSAENSPVHGEARFDWNVNPIPSTRPPVNPRMRSSPPLPPRCPSATSEFTTAASPRAFPVDDNEDIATALKSLANAPQQKPEAPRQPEAPEPVKPPEQPALPFSTRQHCCLCFEDFPFLGLARELRTRDSAPANFTILCRDLTGTGTKPGNAPFVHAICWRCLSHCLQQRGSPTQGPIALPCPMNRVGCNGGFGPADIAVLRSLAGPAPRNATSSGRSTPIDLKLQQSLQSPSSAAPSPISGDSVAILDGIVRLCGEHLLNYVACGECGIGGQRIPGCMTIVCDGTPTLDGSLARGCGSLCCCVCGKTERQLGMPLPVHQRQTCPASLEMLPGFPAAGSSKSTQTTTTKCFEHLSHVTLYCYLAYVFGFCDPATLRHWLNGCSGRFSPAAQSYVTSAQSIAKAIVKGKAVYPKSKDFDFIRHRLTIPSVLQDVVQSDLQPALQSFCSGSEPTNHTTTKAPSATLGRLLKWR